MAGAGLEQIAPNLLLFLVLQEYPSDVPTLSPTLETKIAPVDRTLDPNQPHTGGDTASSPVNQKPVSAESAEHPNTERNPL